MTPWMVLLLTLVLSDLSFAASACDRISATMAATESGVQYLDLEQGKGQEAAPGDTAKVHYTGWLPDAGCRKFDSSQDHGQPFSFRLGAGEVIRGWEDAVSSMKKGGKRLLLIPAELGYGARGAGNVIPPNARLLFEVELLDLR